MAVCANTRGALRHASDGSGNSQLFNMQSNNYYGFEFYASHCEGSLQSARVVVPLITRLLKPGSVVDVGCGLGTWLCAFRECGVETIMGLDGKHVDQSRLYIPKECFQATELSEPFRLDKKFDLAMSLEVAEHLPPRSAEGFVRSLVGLAPAIVFSAAIPLQSGTHHVNERWPEYWRTLFLRHNYRRLDLLRKHIWTDGRVEWWYRQNLFLYVSEALVTAKIEFREAATESDDLLLLHPDILRRHLALRASLKRLPGLVLKALRRRFQGALVDRS